MTDHGAAVHTPADDVAVWASTATGPLQFVAALAALCAFVGVAIRYARRAARNV